MLRIDRILFHLVKCLLFQTTNHDKTHRKAGRLTCNRVIVE
jgi:hypothetical protein